MRVSIPLVRVEVLKLVELVELVELVIRRAGGAGGRHWKITRSIVTGSFRDLQPNEWASSRPCKTNYLPLPPDWLPN